MENTLVVVRGQGGLGRGGKWDPAGDGNIVCLHCINANIPVATLCSSFTRCYLWGNWKKIDCNISALFLQLHWNLQLCLSKMFNLERS